MSKNYKIILRVGGFHKVKSYLGFIGMIMAGSGLEEAMKLVFDGEGTVDEIMKGGNYSKCVRAHRLISKALVLSAKDLFEDEIDTSVLERIKSMGQTPALWVQYLEMTLTVNQFIRAEKTGDYKLYLQSTRAMAPIFASTGHLNYVKASRLMIQMYDEWIAKYRTMVHEFFGAGHHTVRYSDREWAGTWSGMSIEETLMRSTKSSGGLARGAMRNDDSLKVWLHTATHKAVISEGMAKVYQKMTKKMDLIVCSLILIQVQLPWRETNQLWQLWSSFLKTLVSLTETGSLRSWFR